MNEAAGTHDRPTDPLDDPARTALAVRKPATLLTALGFTGALIGLLVIADPRTRAVWAIVLIAVAALVIGSGIAWLTRLQRHLRYRIGTPFDPKPLLIGLLGLVLIIAAIIVVAGVLHVQAGGLLVLTLPGVVVWYRRKITAAQLDWGGIEAAGTRWSWDQIDGVVVQQSGADTVLEVCAQGAPIGIRVDADRVHVSRLAEVLSRFSSGRVSLTRRNSPSATSPNDPRHD